VKKRVDILLVERDSQRAARRRRRSCSPGGLPGPRNLSEQIDEGAELAGHGRQPFVSRGGIKLANALDAFDVDPAGRDCLDVGASTGGFTTSLLSGARRVDPRSTSVNGQLHRRFAKTRAWSFLNERTRAT